MPEGDTVWRTATRLHQALAGQRLTGAELRWGALIDLDLVGATTTEVRSRGKHLLHRLDTGLTIHSHLRMEGQWRVEATERLGPTQREDHQIRALLITERWAALGLRLGMLDVVATEREGELVGHLGPDVLGADWDPALAAERIGSSASTGSDPYSETDIGSALLDQRNLAGVGTMYAAEVLFLEKVNPWTPVAQLSPETVLELVNRVHGLLDVGRRSAIQSTTGDARNGYTTYVHARSGRPCRRCGGVVRVALIGPVLQQRTMFYCPACQGGLAPADDGRPQRPLGSSPRGSRGRYPRT